MKRFKKNDPESCSLLTRAGTVTFSLTRSSRRRTIEISVGDSMEVRVVAPRYTLQMEIHRFIHDKADWIIEKLKETRQVQKTLRGRKYQEGHKFLFLGKKYTLEVIQADISKTGIAFDGLKWTVRVPFTVSQEGYQPLVRKEMIQWYRAQAKEIFGGRIFHYARIMGLEPQRIAVKTQKRIWGSCNHRGKAINLNWCLVLSPVDVIDYVIVHELMHLEVNNHSKRFWRRVEDILPDYKRRQGWLKANALDMTLP